MMSNEELQAIRKRAADMIGDVPLTKETAKFLQGRGILIEIAPELSTDVYSLLSHISELESELEKKNKALQEISKGNHGVDDNGLFIQPSEVARAALDSHE